MQNSAAPHDDKLPTGCGYSIHKMQFYKPQPTTCYQSILRMSTDVCFSLPSASFSATGPSRLFGDLIHHHCAPVDEPGTWNRRWSNSHYIYSTIYGIWKCESKQHRRGVPHHSLPKQHRWGQQLHFIDWPPEIFLTTTPAQITLVPVFVIWLSCCGVWMMFEGKSQHFLSVLLSDVQASETLVGL